IRFEEEPDVFAQEWIGFHRRSGRRTNGRDGDFLILEGAGLVERLEVLQVEKAIAIDRVLDELAAVGEDGRLVNATKAAGGIDRAGEESQILRQVRQVDLGQLAFGLLAIPLEGL